MLATVMDDMSDGLCLEDGRRRKPPVSSNRHNDWPACSVLGLLLLTVCDCGLPCVPSDVIWGRDLIAGAVFGTLSVFLKTPMHSVVIQP